MRLRKARSRAFEKQNGLCCYCGLPMAPDIASASAFAVQYGLTLKQAQALLATAEHRIARCDGGRDTADNIAAAHLVCNRRRHACKRPKTSEDYGRHVRSRCARGKWHSTQILRLRRLD